MILYKCEYQVKHSFLFLSRESQDSANSNTRQLCRQGTIYACIHIGHNILFTGISHA